MWTSLMDKSLNRPPGLPEGPAACDLPTAVAHKKVRKRHGGVQQCGKGATVRGSARRARRCVVQGEAVALF